MSAKAMQYNKLATQYMLAHATEYISWLHTVQYILVQVIEHNNCDYTSGHMLYVSTLYVTIKVINYTAMHVL